MVHAETVQQIAAIKEPTTRHQVVGKGERWRVYDIIFPKIDPCLIMLAGWFSPSPTKNNFGIWSFTQIAAPPWCVLSCTSSYAHVEWKFSCLIGFMDDQIHVSILQLAVLYFMSSFRLKRSNQRFAEGKYTCFPNHQNIWIRWVRPPQSA